MRRTTCRDLTTRTRRWTVHDVEPIASTTRPPSVDTAAGCPLDRGVSNAPHLLGDIEEEPQAAPGTDDGASWRGPWPFRRSRRPRRPRAWTEGPRSPMAHATRKRVHQGSGPEPVPHRNAGAVPRSVVAPAPSCRHAAGSVATSRHLLERIPELSSSRYAGALERRELLKGARGTPVTSSPPARPRPAPRRSPARRPGAAYVARGFRTADHLVEASPVTMVTNRRDRFTVSSLRRSERSRHPGRSPPRRLPCRACGWRRRTGGCAVPRKRPHRVEVRPGHFGRDSVVTPCAGISPISGALGSEPEPGVETGAEVLSATQAARRRTKCRSDGPASGRPAPRRLQPVNESRPRRPEGRPLALVQEVGSCAKLPTAAPSPGAPVCIPP